MTPAAEPFYPGPIALPSDRAWLDPGLVSRSLFVRVTAVAAGGTRRIAELNADRWAVGFVMAPGSSGGVVVAPWSDVTNAQGWSLSALAPLWFKLFDYGPLVTGEWWAAGTDAVTGSVRLVEVIRRRGDTSRVYERRKNGPAQNPGRVESGG